MIIYEFDSLEEYIDIILFVFLLLRLYKYFFFLVDLIIEKINN